MEEHENTAETRENGRQNEGAEMDGEIDRQVSVSLGTDSTVQNNTIYNVRHIHYNV